MILMIEPVNQHKQTINSVTSLKSFSQRQTEGINSPVQQPASEDSIHHNYDED